jgi:P27 family predicted phage terminase small subunit
MQKIPTHLTLLRGNPGKRAINRNEPEPAVPDTPPDPPDFLNEDAKNEWWKVVPELMRLGLLTVLDHAPLAAYCQAYGRWMMAERALARMAAGDAQLSGFMIKGSSGSPMANPLVKIARCEAENMVRYGAEFGLSPRARTHLNVAGRLTGPSKFDGLLAR